MSLLDRISRFAFALLLILAIAVSMAILGSVAMSWAYPNAMFGKYDLVWPSVLAWLIFCWPLRTPTQERIVGCGIISVILGAFFACLFRVGATDFLMAKPVGIVDVFRNYLGSIAYGFVGALIYLPVDLPICLATSCLVATVWKTTGLSVVAPTGLGA